MLRRREVQQTTEEKHFLYGGVSVIPVLYVVLHIKVVDQQRVTEFGVTHSLIQWETCQEMKKNL